MTPQTAEVKTYLQGLQQRIMDAVANRDGSPVTVDPWTKPAGEKLQGEGVTSLHDYIGRKKEGQTQIYYLAGAPAALRCACCAALRCAPTPHACS